jgi:chromosomal replication initiation ATPase DnaA
MVAMALCRTLTKYSAQDIGNCFERDHGTVLNAVKNVANWRSVDMDFRQEYGEIEGRARGQLAAISIKPI